MVEWNPVKGLEEIKYEDLREGDEVVMFSFNEHYKRVTINHIGRFGYNNKYYLLERPVVEPVNRGDIAEIYRPNPKGSESEEVETYIRTRPKFLDEDLNNDEAWTDSQNNVTVPWEEIVRKSKEKQDFKLRIFKATYKEDV